MRYQMIMKHFTLALALGSALPLSYWLVTLLCAVTFWIDKYNVLRLYKKPVGREQERGLWLYVRDARDAGVWTGWCDHGDWQTECCDGVTRTQGPLRRACGGT